MEGFFNIFAEKIGDTVPKKRRVFRLVFYTFWVGKSEAQYQKKRSKKGGHSVLFFYIFGREIGGTVPKKRRAFRPVV